MIELPTQERLKELFDYDEVRGVLIAKTNRPKCPIGTIIGSKTQEGRLICRVDTTIYYVHRLIWKWWYGTEPALLVDHKNGNVADNRIMNLRSADFQENGYNRSVNFNTRSKMKGAHWSETEQKWRSSMRRNGESIHLGWFASKQEAAEAYQKHAEKMQGEFSVVRSRLPSKI